MNAVIAFALRRRLLVIVLFALSLLLGSTAFSGLNIEAYPDPVPPLVDVITQNPGQSAEEIERYITIPLEIQLAGIPNLKVMRAISLFGLSDIKLQFTYDYTYEEAEPEGAEPSRPGPIASQQRTPANLAMEPDRRDSALQADRSPRL